MNRPQNIPTAYACPIPIMYWAQDRVIHTNEHPFCWDERCPCKEADGELWVEYLDTPVKDGLLTVREANRILYDKQV